uniref:Uncharacterized protein n=1 Tax=Arundo donax TaxID=35708 RepID=A0A0A9C4S9_ARUDO
MAPKMGPLMRVVSK